MKLEHKRDYQMFDFPSVMWAGLISGLLFFAAVCLLMPLNHPEIDSPLMIRMFSSVILGAGALTPATFTPFTLGVGLFVNLLLSISFTALLAFIVHKWGLLGSIVAGALLGLALYGINFYSMTYFFPWFWTMQTQTMLICHVLFGALSGGLYELFERPRHDATIV